MLNIFSSALTISLHLNWHVRMEILKWKMKMEVSFTPDGYFILEILSWKLKTYMRKYLNIWIEEWEVLNYFRKRIERYSYWFYQLQTSGELKLR